MYNRGLPGNDDVDVSALHSELEQERIRRGAAEVLGRHIDDLRRLLPAPGKPSA
jgi:hypothetical protein